MLTEFTLDDAFFQSESLQDQYQSNTHDFIINTWKNYGVLIMPESKRDNLLQEIKNLPIKYQQRWINAFSHFKICFTDCSWDRLENLTKPTDLIPLCSLFKTALTSELAHLVTEDMLANDSHVCAQLKTNKFEILASGNSSESENFNRSKRASTESISNNADITRIWKEKFENLAKYAKRISIIDRYLFSRTLDDFNNNRKTNMANFVALLTNQNRPYNLTIISCDQPTRDGKLDRDKIIECYDEIIFSNPPLRKSVASLRLTSNDIRYFQKFSHERFLKFDEHVCTIGNGMQIFEEQPLALTEFAILHKDDTSFSLRENESRISQKWTHVY